MNSKRSMQVSLALVFFVVFNFSCTESVKEVDNQEITEVNPVLTAINQEIKDNPNNPDHYFKRAQYFMGISGNYQDIVNDLERALAIDSSKSAYFLLLADAHMAVQKTIPARNALTRCINNVPKGTEARIKLGEIYLLLGDYSKSIELINQVLKLDESNALAYYMKGLNYKYLNDTAKAVSSFQTALDVNPEYYDAHLQLADLYAGINHPMALEYYNAAILSKPNGVEAIYNKSLFLQNNNKLDKALEGYGLVIKIDSSFAMAYHNIGYIHLIYLKDYPKSIDYFQKAIHWDSAYIGAYYNLGLSYEKMKDYNSAKKHYQRALQLDPTYDLAAKGLSRIETVK